MSTVIYKGIVKDALEMSGIYFDDNGQRDYRMEEEVRFRKAPAIYRVIRNNDYLNKVDDYVNLI